MQPRSLSRAVNIGRLQSGITPVLMAVKYARQEQLKVGSVSLGLALDKLPCLRAAGGRAWSNSWSTRRCGLSPCMSRPSPLGHTLAAKSDLYSALSILCEFILE